MNPSFFHGLFALPIWAYAVITFALVQLMVLAITLYLHRDQSHGGLELHPALRHFFRFWLWLSSGTVARLPRYETRPRVGRTVAQSSE